MIDTFFRLSKTRIINKRLLRDAGMWTTNGQWALQTVREPKFMSQLKSNGTPPRSIDDILAMETIHALYKMTISHDMSFGKDILAVKLESDSGFYTWINVYYLVMFMKLKMKLKYLCSGQDQPLIFKDKYDNIIGLIMPVII